MLCVCVRGRVSVQILVYANGPPGNGTCVASSQQGLSLTTAFTIGCRRWLDREGHYPLTYQFSAVREGRWTALSSPSYNRNLSVRPSHFFHSIPLALPDP